MLKISELWAGSEKSLDSFIARLSNKPSDAWFSQIQAASRSSMRRAHPNVDIDNLSYQEVMALSLIDRYGNVGVIRISGDLVAGEDIVNEWYGAVGYTTIARAMEFAASDESLTKLVLSIDSGGGDAVGIDEAAAAIKEAGKQKPVYTWTGSQMQSAAYWLGASGKKVYSSQVAMVGSIGVVATFVSRARMLNEAGIDPLIIRSSSDKAPLNPLEPASEKGIADLKEKVNTMAGLFVSHIEQARPSLKSKSRGIWASGKTFFAADAIDNGLIDKIISLSGLVSSLQDAIPTNSTQVIEMPKRILMNADPDLSLAMIEAGVGAGEVVGMTEQPDEPTEKEAPEVPATPEPTQAQAQAQAQAAAQATEPTNTVSMMDSLLAKVTELTQKKAELEAQVTQMTQQATLAQSEASALTSLMVPVRASIQRLAVATGSKVVGLDELGPESLVRIYDELSSKLRELPTGRKSIPQATTGNQVDLATQRILELTSN